MRTSACKDTTGNRDTRNTRSATGNSTGLAQSALQWAVRGLALAAAGLGSTADAIRPEGRRTSFALATPVATHAALALPHTHHGFEAITTALPATQRVTALRAFHALALAHEVARHVRDITGWPLDLSRVTIAIATPGELAAQEAPDLGSDACAQLRHAVTPALYAPNNRTIFVNGILAERGTWNDLRLALTRALTHAAQHQRHPRVYEAFWSQQSTIAQARHRATSPQALAEMTRKGDALAEVIEGHAMAVQQQAAPLYPTGTSMVALSDVAAAQVYEECRHNTRNAKNVGPALSGARKFAGLMKVHDTRAADRVFSRAGKQARAWGT